MSTAHINGRNQTGDHPSRSAALELSYPFGRLPLQRLLPKYNCRSFFCFVRRVGLSSRWRDDQPTVRFSRCPVP